MIIIVTVYKSANYGSYLQAFMLYKALCKYGDVCFLDCGQRSYVGITDIRDSLGAILLRLDFKRVVSNIRRLLANKKMWSSLPRISIKEANSLKDPFFILGSDEIWNISKRKNRQPVFWGRGLNGVISSYAPSINMANTEQLVDFGATDYLENMKAISVRDDYSLERLSELTTKKIHKVLDPTLLFSKEKYQIEKKNQKLPFKYIAIYMFIGNKKDVYEETIKKFATEKKLKIVSIGTQVHWADLNLTSEQAGTVPFLYYLDAEYVFTNTFHGTAFAINFEANFVSYARTNKIKDLLNTFGLTRRDATNLEYSSVCNILSNPIDKAELKRKKFELQKQSFDYLSKIFDHD